MAITITADKVDELPEPIRGSAVEQNGKFLLQQLPDGWGVDNVAAYRSKATKAEQDAKRAAERMRAFAKDDKGTIYEPDEFQALLQEHRALKEAQGKQVDVEAFKRQFQADAEKKWGAELAAERKAREELDAMLDRTMTDAETNALVAMLRPKDGNQEVVKLLLREAVRVDKRDGKRAMRAVGQNGEFLVSSTSEDGYVSPKEYAQTVLRTKYAHLLESESSGGAGATSSGSRRGPGTYQFKRSELATNAPAFIEMQKRAKAEGKTVELIDA